MGLSDTFIKTYADNHDPIIIFDNRLYTIHRNNNLSDSFYFVNGLKLSIEESKTVFELEREYLNSNLVAINLLLDETIKNDIVARVKESKTKVNQIKNSLEERLRNIGGIISDSEDFSIDRLLIHTSYEFLNIYSIGGSKPIKIPDIERLKQIEAEDVSETDISRPSLSDIETKQGQTILNTANGEGLLVIGYRAFELKQQRGKESDHEFVQLTRKKYSLVFIGAVDKVEGDYKGHIIRHIKDKALQHGHSWLKKIEKNENIQKKFHKKLREAKHILKDYTALAGIDYRRVEGGYEIFLLIPDFIIQKDRVHYLFKKEGMLKAGIKLEVAPKYVKITETPRVLNMPYHHPFVFKKDNISGKPEGAICYNDLTRFIEDGIQINENMPLRNLDYKELGSQVAYSLNHGLNNLTKGYQEGVNPVSTLDTSNFKDQIVYDKKIISKHKV